MAEIVDIQLALEQANGSEELAKELFTMLINDLPILLENLNQAFLNQDEQALRDQAHKIYGSTAYCGVPHLRDASNALENSIKLQLPEIENNIKNVKIAIEQLIGQSEIILDKSWQ
jgi:two-component system sensor histidine kinase BarA